MNRSGKMREILFRGKYIDNGEWIYGWYCKYAFGKWPIKSCIIPSEQAENGCLEHIEVDPSTISQYTGMTDKNGTGIFEGDIVKDTICEFKKGVVKFITGTFDSGIYEYNGWVVEDKDGDVDHNPLTQYIKDSFGCGYGFEIIGNIYDNP